MPAVRRVLFVKGDDGVVAEFGMCYRLPTQESVSEAKKAAAQEPPRSAGEVLDETQWISLATRTFVKFGQEDLNSAANGDQFAVEDSDDMATWRRSILERVSKNKWNILDESGETILESHPHKGDQGVVAEFGMYYRLPTQESVREAREAVAQEASASAKDVVVSPRRKRIREEAAEAQAKMGKQMARRAAKTAGAGAVAVGTMVQVSVDNVDRAKVDPTNATLVVVETVRLPHPSVHACAQACMHAPLLPLSQCI